MKNKLIYIVIGMLCFTSTNGFCEESKTPPTCSDAYRYATIGVGPIVLIPNVSIGYRTRHFQGGKDAALGFSTVGYAHQISAHIAGHYYLEPLQPTSSYLGFGVMGSGFFTNKGQGGGTISPDFIFGKEWKEPTSTHFWELHVAIPTLAVGKQTKPLYFPLMYIKYGISF